MREKLVMKDSRINNYDMSLKTTTDDNTKHSTKVNKSTNNNEEKEINSTHTKSCAKTTPYFDTNTELNNSVRQTEQNSVHTDLFEIVVIHTNDDNKNT